MRWHRECREVIAPPTVSISGRGKRDPQGRHGRMVTVEALEQQIKELIIDVLMLEDVTPADIESQAALFVEGLGLAADR